MVRSATKDASHDAAVLQALIGLREFTDVMDRVHNSMKTDMDMNASDIAALRMIIMREQRGELVRPHDVSEHLRISSASTTKLLDRLTESGHVARRPHPHDRRARVIELTDASRREFYRHFGGRLAVMREVAERYDDGELDVVTRFVGDLSHALDPD